MFLVFAGQAPVCWGAPQTCRMGPQGTGRGVHCPGLRGVHRQALGEPGHSLGTRSSALRGGYGFSDISCLMILFVPYTE